MLLEFHMHTVYWLIFVSILFLGCGIKQIRENTDATKSRTEEIYRWQQQQISSDKTRDSILFELSNQVNGMEIQLRSYQALTSNRFQELELQLNKVNQSVLEASGRFSDVAMGVSEVRKRVLGDSVDDDTTSARTALDAAEKDYAVGSYELAIAGYSTFLERWANSPLAGNAYYGRGQAKLALKDTSGAIADWRASIQSPGTRTATAAWQLGKLLLAKKDKKGARDVWQALIKKYPDTPEAKRAKEQIQILDKRK